jgi:signal transduction histidine kinase
VIVMFAIMQIAFSAVFLVYQRASIHGYFELRLSEAADALALELRARVPDLTDSDLQVLEQRETRSAPFEQFLLTVYDQTGGIIASTQRPPLPPDQLDLASAFALGSRIEQRMPVSILEDPDADARIARTVLRRFSASDGRDYALFTATSDAYAQRMLRVVYNVLLVSAPIGLLAAAASGWLIAGIAVRPLHDVRQIVMGISPESIGKRLPASSRDFEIARLESDLDAARKRIEQGFQAQARFMSNVSHELKTPISILLTESETLNVSEAPSEVRAFVYSVHEEMRRLATLIDSFLTLTRVRDGQRTTASQRCPINDLVMDSVEHCAPMASQYAVTLAPQLIEGRAMSAAVAGDPHLLTTMIDNLVRNSIRFTPEGGSVEIRAAANGDKGIISVRDYGVGIPESLIDHVFDRFAQAEAEERMGRGHGLGLEIAQGIAELHSGAISAMNCDDAGCVFTIELPLLQSADD